MMTMGVCEMSNRIGWGWRQNYFSSIIQIKKAVLVDAYEYHVYSICRQWDAYEYFSEYELLTRGVINDHTPLTFSRNKQQKKKNSNQNISSPTPPQTK